MTARGLVARPGRSGRGSPALVVAAVVGATNIHFAEVRRKDASLRVAQQAVEEMARIAERERIGRDLHDLLGHTLSVDRAEVGAGLASSPTATRRAPRSRSATSSASRATRSTEVRKAVRGYRSDGLLDEVANAERVLVAAGITPRDRRRPRPTCRRTKIARSPTRSARP